MKKRRWGKRALFQVVASAAIAAAVIPQQSATAARVTGTEALPQAYLLKLDSASTVRAFRRNRDEGLGSARAAARSQKSAIRRVQEEVIDELPADADVLYRTHSLLAGIGVNATTGDRDLLEEIPGVQAVYPVAPKKLRNAYAVPFQSAPVAWQSTGYLGQGQKIAVIDTGIDYTHSGFGGPGTELAYEEAQSTQDQPADPGLFPNEKIIGGIDLVGDDYDAASDDDSQLVPKPDSNPLDCEGHGSHVAGSAAGYGVKPDGSTYSGPYDETTDFGAMKVGPGMAPEADIYAIKVFGCTGSTNVVVEAIDHAVDPNGDGDPSDRVDVINLSLGSDFGSPQDGDSVAANTAAEMGVAVVAAAGNAGDHTDIGGSPNDAPRVLSVASTVDAESKIDGAAVTIDGDQESFGITRSVRYDWKDDPDLSGPVVAAPPANETACSPYPPNTFNGKVVIVKWHDAAPECGSIARGDNLAAAGAIGFIFGSDSESFSAGISGDDEIPGVLMVASGAEAIRDALENDLEVTVDGTEANSVTRNIPEDNDKVSSFSSRGIHAAGNVKPDVAAVGSSVFSVAVGTGDDGVGSSGTSMASPMVAGLAALVRQANPDWNPLQVKAGIMNTARHDLFVEGSADPSSGRYGPPRVGAGRIDAADAVANEVLAYDAADGAVSVSFGPVEADAPVTLSRTVTVDNQSSSAATYGVAYDPINEVPGAGFTVTPSELTLDPGEVATVTVTLEVSDPKQLTKAVDPTVGRLGSLGNPRETLAEAFGRLLLEPTGPGATLRVPVYASPRPASKMTQPDSLRIHRLAGNADAPTQAATIELTGEGLGSESGQNGKGDGDPENDIESLAAGFGLMATSGEAPQCDQEIVAGCWRLPEERNADIRLVGYSSNAPYVSNPANARGYFAFATHQPWALPSDKVQIEVAIDADGDNEPDLHVFNTRLGEDDTFVSALYDPAKPSGQRVIDRQLINGRLGSLDTALYDSDVMVLPVALEKLAAYGITPESPRISFGIETYTGFSHQPIDLIGVDADSGDLVYPMSADLFEPGLTVTDEDGKGPLVSDQPGEELTVTRNIASYETDAGQGLMMVHFHNKVGAKAEVVNLRGADSSTALSIAPGTLTAKVEAVAPGLPVPSGAVTFSVDGVQVGWAPLVDGVAVLGHQVPSGASRQIEADYFGDADFEASSDQAERSDPQITARLSSQSRKNSRGWYRRPVTVTFTCTTNGSELAEACPQAHRVTRDGRGLSVTRTIVALDGGTATVRVGGIKIDQTRPVVRIRGVRRGATYGKLRRARCVARDRTSGILHCRIQRKRRGKIVIYKATATDKAGNRRTVKLRTRLRR